MAGEDFFKFNKGNEFRFSNFREIKEEALKGADEKTKKLFNIFAGEDKILQEVEAKSLFNVLKSAAGDNQVLEDNEIKMFTKKHIGEEVDTNILANFVNNIFGTKEKPQTQAVQVAQNGVVSKQQQAFLEEIACKEIVIDIIDENLSEAYEILNSQSLGSISGWHDERKDKNDILKTSNVSKVLDYQNAGIEWMNKAKLAPPNGLTKKEYYEGNKQRIKDMILTRILVLDTNTKFKELKNKYSEEKLAQRIGDYVEQLCSNASIEDLKNFQKQLVSYSVVEETLVLENIVDKAIKYNDDKNFKPSREFLSFKMNARTGIIPEYWDTDEPISFEEVYKIERGTEYSQYKIEQYVLAKKEMEIVANAYNKKQQFVEFTEGLRKDKTLNIDEKTQKVLEGFATFYALSEDGGLSQLQELITKSKLPISIDENGFNFGTLDDNAKNRALNSLLKFAQQSKEKEFEKFLKGKTIEDYQKALAQAQNDAIGDENGKMMAEAMKNDNLTCIQRWTGNTSMAGMGMTIVGGILCFTPLAPLGATMVTAGNTLAIGGMVAKTGLGVTDYATKDVQTAEEAEQLTKDFIMDAGGFIIGMRAGKAGLKAFSNLIDKKLVAVFGKKITSGNKMQALKTVFTNPEYLKNFMTAAGAKLSADFVISYAGDLAMMGILDTQDDWQSLLKANLTGILVGMSGDIKDVSGVGRPRNFRVSDGVKGVNEASRFDQPTSPHVKKPMTEMDYGQRLLGNDVTVAVPRTGATVEGTVTGLHNTNGQVEIEVNGQRYSTNDVAEVKGEAKVETTKTEALDEKPQITTPIKSQAIDITTLKIEKASDEDLKEIQKIDLEAFEGKYTIESDFDAYKADLVNQEITTYAIKGEDGKVIGYYQLEPVKNGELYIHSIGVRSDLRNTKASYAALKQMQDNITKFAQENNIEKVVLDVDADNSALVKLYKKFGFEVTDETSGVEAGHQYHDYRMEVQVKKNNTTLDNKDLPFVTKLEGMTWINSKGKKVLRFDPNVIKALVEAYKENPKLVTKLVDATMFNDKGQEVPRFSGYEIKKLIGASKENSELVTKLVDATMFNDNNQEVPRFKGYVIKGLVKAYKENPKLVTKLVNATMFNDNNQEVPRFSGYEIKKLVEAYKENQEAVTKLVDATMFNDKGRKVPRFNGYEIYALVGASKENPDLFKKLRENEDIPLSGQSFIDFFKLSENDYKKIKNIIIHFYNNINSLKHQDMDVTRNMVAELIVQNQEGVLNIINLIGESALHHASELRYRGLEQLLENATSLSNLDEGTKITLRNKLNALPHPEQKLAKLEIISALAGNVDKTAITKILDEIKAPQMTKEQKELANEIFSTNKPYEEQIEDFIREFNVPDERQDLIRKFLLNQKLSEKYVKPQSIDEQIAIMDKKIQSIQRNDKKIPANIKQAYLSQLELEKAEILTNPEQYTQARINERAMKPLEAQVEAHINLPNQNNAFSKALIKEIYNILKIDPTEELLTDVTYDSKYISKMFAGMSDSNFRRNFNELINMIKENPNRKFTDIIQEIPENIETKELFEENGLDFDRWIKFNEDSYEPFVVTVDIDKSVRSAKQNLKNELNSELAKRLDQNQIEKINQILVKNGFETAGQKDLPKIIKLIEKELDTGEYWKQNTPEIKTFKEHIQIHKKNFHDVAQLKDATEELHVRLWDKDDVGRNIFFGNHVGCCTSVGSSNSFAAPQHLMNAFVNGIEIVDKAGNSMGNSMCYFAKVDGKLTFVIDSFEANGKLGSAPEVTDAIIEYAKKVCAEMGQPDANIMFGPNYNNIDFSRCIKTKGHTIEIIGRAPENTYIDCIRGRGNINSVASERPMYEIMDL